MKKMPVLDYIKYNPVSQEILYKMKFVSEFANSERCQNETK